MLPDLRWNPIPPEAHADPYPFYARLREADPVHREQGDAGEFFVATRHADVVSVLRDARCSTWRFPEALIQAALAGPAGDLRTLARAVTGMMLIKNPPDHTRLRGLVAKAFTPRVVEGLRPRIEAIVAELLAGMKNAGGMEVLRDFAAPFPVIVIAELLGVPAADREKFKSWSDDLALFVDGSVRDASLPLAARAAAELTEYLEAFIERRRQQPREDLMSGLIAAHEQGDALSQDELVGTAILLLAAGHETTTNLIGNGLLAMLRHPREFERLRREPALARSAVEELLRWDSPVQLTSRMTRVPIELSGCVIPADREINLVLGAANHDPAVFHEPGRLDLARADNRHVSFGQGAHFCLGAPLARLEGQIAFEQIALRFPGLRLASAPLAWRPGRVLRGLQALAVEF